MTGNARYLWHAGRLESWDGVETRLDVADSWLVSDGRSCALAAHRARFLGAVAPERRPELDASAFWDAAIARIPRRGEWFPRMELWPAETGRSGSGQRDSARLALLLRPAPPRALSVTLATHLGPDPRTAPRVKGPDLATLGRLRREARDEGADEPVILTSSGFVVDGASSAILWWRGDALCAPPIEFARIQSVTASAILAIAGALGIPVRREPVTPKDLDGLEIWAVNALHGIRLVTAWIGGPAPVATPHRLALWRARLNALRMPLTGSPL